MHLNETTYSILFDDYNMAFFQPKSKLAAILRPKILDFSMPFLSRKPRPRCFNLKSFLASRLGVAEKNRFKVLLHVLKNRSLFLAIDLHLHLLLALPLSLFATKPLSALTLTLSLIPSPYLPLSISHCLPTSPC